MQYTRSDTVPSNRYKDNLIKIHNYRIKHNLGLASPKKQRLNAQDTLTSFPGTDQ
jgi:hypothetical protein